MANSDVHLSRSCARVALTFAAAVAIVSALAAQGSTPDCSEPQACRELALEARARGAYETFHNLAWRAVQTGPPNDPDLMYFLARAQALSGRRRDAVIMLRRLAEAGFANDAATDDDFRRVRELPDWPYVAALASRARPVAPGAAPPATDVKPAVPEAKPVTAAPAAAGRGESPATAPKPAMPVAAPPKPAAAPPAAAAVRSALRVEPALVNDAARFSTARFTPGGLAYDAVSRRFLFGDTSGRRLFVVGEGSDRTIDLVRADAAGFDDVTAIAIDPRRGDLWVASTATDGSAGAVHRLQLISGRAVAKLSVPGQGPMRLRDLAVTGDGTVLVLDSAAPRLLVLRPGEKALNVLMPLTNPEPASVTVDDTGRFAYVAHRGGIARVDMQTRRAAPAKAAEGIELGGFEHLRWHRDTLVGSQAQPDGSQAFIRLQLNREGQTVTTATLIDNLGSSEDGVPFATISGDDLYYLAGEERENRTAPSGLVDVRVRRLKLGD